MTVRRITAAFAVLLAVTVRAPAEPAQGPAPGQGQASAQTGADRAAVSGRLATVQPKVSTDAVETAFDGIVEAVRQTAVAAQVPGVIVALDARVGDRVAAGQVLARIDARTAEQTAQAGDAQVRAARAAAEIADKELARQQQLHARQYVSRAALERAEAQAKSAQAQLNAQIAQAGAARTQSGLHVVRAPFDGVVAEVPVSIGDLAMPGRPLAIVYDPSALRVAAALPQTAAAGWNPHAPARIELAGRSGPDRSVTATAARLVPTADPATLTVQLRADLPAGIVGVVPGQFARVWLKTPSAATATRPRLTVPEKSLVHRSEVTGVYVLDERDAPVLRQIRIGRPDGDQVEVLSGLKPTDRVVVDPAAALRAP